MINKFWNDRYQEPEYAYGKDPNIFLEEILTDLQPGKIILPCDGEGRNAVFAAKKGWHVQAFDLSEAGRLKALQLATKSNVTIEYKLEDAVTISYPENSVDVVAFIYAHFPIEIRKKIHQKAIDWLKPGGKIILEAFNPYQIQNNSGGPKDQSMLYSEEIIQDDFASLKIEQLQTISTNLKEGKYHHGIADIIRFIGSKK